MGRPEPVELPVGMEIYSEEEAKVPTVAEARLRFDQVEGVPTKKVSKVEIQPKGPPAVPFAPKKIMAPVKKPAPPKPVARPDMVAKEGVKSPSPRLLISDISMPCVKKSLFYVFGCPPTMCLSYC